MADQKKGNESNPFEALLEDIQNLKPVDLQAKEQKRPENRSVDRQNLSGSAAIFDTHEKLISKAVIRNLSPGGAGFEIFPIDLKAGSQVFIQFSHAPDLGMVSCTVQWIANIEGHRNQHKMIGLKFNHLTSLNQEKLNKFLETLRNVGGYDPFSR